jgi:hypothetical protein
MSTAYAPAAHHASEPTHLAVSGEPCPSCGVDVFYERARTGEPMLWAHRDGSPALPHLAGSVTA